MSDAEELLNYWVETVQDYAIFLLDTSGNVASWNAGAERILGYGESEIMGRPGSIIFTPEDIERGEPEKELGTALEAGRAQDERWHVRKDDSRFWGSGIVNPLRDERGNLRGFVKAFRDLTERKQLEDQLRLDDRRKNEFLAMLSHELRNPLSSILNSVFVLRQQLPTDDPVIQEARDTIERQVTNLKRLVDDLMDVARVATHKVRLQKKPVALADIVRDAVKDVAPLMAERRHGLTVSLDAAGGAMLDADPTRLGQVLANLLTNAAKYTEPGGSIWLAARREDGQVVIGVRDTGIGIAPEMLPRVFDLFAQADLPTERTQGGLGIGLALVRSLVGMHGGAIEARSEGVGRGSEFIVRLPALPASNDMGVESPPEAGTPKVQPSRVLVVEDNTDAARSLGLLLRRAGHEVHIAHDGQTALRMAREHPPRVVLLDISLPGMSGYEVASALREHSHVRLVAMTGFAEDEKAREAGFDRFLVKPVDPDELLRLLSELGRP